MTSISQEHTDKAQSVKTRSMAQSLKRWIPERWHVHVFLWIACFILTFTFPILNKKLGSAGTFWLYAAICVAGFLFVKFKLPETKGKTLEQIERELVK